MHVIVGADSAILVEVVSLRCCLEMLCEFGVGVERFDAGENVSEVHLKRLATNHHLSALELRTTRKFLIDQFVEGGCIIVG
jgi:hypothetical protein